jgi:ABC-type multidrug transport system ATPase subunit
MSTDRLSQMTAAAPAVSDWPDLPITTDHVTIGRSEECTLCLRHASISRQHARISRNGNHIDIEDLDSRFGTFVNGVRIRKTALQLNDIVRLGSSPPYRFVGSDLRVVLEGTGMSLALKGLTVVRGGRTIIENVTLAIDSGSFVGVLGPSGMGKSLLLGCLSSTIVPSSGTVEFDGQPVAEHLDYFRSKIGFVTQDDLVFPEMTVQENLMSAAQIRLGSSQDMRSRVNTVIHEVGLDEHHHKLVSVLSGGQRKRVSVAIELLLRPRFLLLDEPTSGLDPGMQARLVETLRSLSRQGMTVVCTTHTMDTLDFFDAVIVLGRQRQAASVRYFGDPRQLLPAFGVRNQADLFERLQQSADAQKIEVESTATTTTTSADQAARRQAPSGAAPMKPRPVEGVRRLRQSAVVWARSVRILSRDLTSVFFVIVQPLVLAALALISQSKHTPVVYSVFFLVLSSLWLGMTLTVREVVRERKLYIRDRLAGLDPEGYLLGKVLYALMMVLLQAGVLWSTASLLAPYTLNPLTAGKFQNTSWLGAILVLGGVGFGGALLGLIISVCARSERVAVMLLPLVLIPQVLFSRVAYGDAEWGWGDNSPYGLIKNGLHLESTDSSDKQAISTDKPAPWAFDMLISLPMVTRPGTAALSLFSDEASASLAAETLYLILVLALYGLALYLLFRVQEHRWLDLRSET